MQRFRFVLQFGCVLLVALVWVIKSNVSGAAQSGAGNGYVPDQVVVKLNPASAVTIEQINATYATTTVRPLVRISGVYLLQTPTGRDAKELAATMAADARLVYAQPNRLSQVIEGEGRTRWAKADADPTLLVSQYAVAQLKLATAHTLSTGTGSIIALLDTGVQLDHPQLAGSFTDAQYDFIDDDPVPTEDFATLDSDHDGFVDSLAGHGTHVAGILHLVAPNAKIMPLRVLDHHGAGNEFALAEAIQFAINNGADVINLSLGTAENSDLLKDLVEDVYKNTDIVIVAAAGNENTDRKQWPAAESYVFAVTSVDATQHKSAFANFGSWVDIAAPGEAISSTFPTNVFAGWSGTSFAVPFVAGQFALLRSLNQSWPSDELYQLVRDTADQLDNDLGAGFPNLVVSLQRIPRGGATPTVTPIPTPEATTTGTPPPTSVTAVPGTTVTPAATHTVTSASTTTPTPIATATPIGNTNNPTPPFYLYLGVIQNK